MLILKYFRRKNASTHLLCKLWNADDLDLNHNGPIIFIHRKICIDKTEECRVTVSSLLYVPILYDVLYLASFLLDRGRRMVMNEDIFHINILENLIEFHPRHRKG